MLQPSFPTLDSVEKLIQSAIAARAFPAATVITTQCGALASHRFFGDFTYDSHSPTVNDETVFDLASLTKVLATTSMAMALFERGIFRLDQPLAEVLTDFADEDSRRTLITFRMLLAHSSGLPAHLRFFETATTKDEVISAALRSPLVTAPGTKVEYSDVGFILLGAALEALAGEELSPFCQREIFAPIGMTRTCFNPPEAWRPDIPPTLNDDYYRNRIIQGEVNDENAYAMGGAAGHAGLFAPAKDVAKFALCMLRGGSPVFKPETVSLFTQRGSSPAGSSRALGWDTPSAPSQSGKYFSPESFGHLGFTGTSLWIDPLRDVSITLLTNRTWPDAKSQAIKQVRPAIHDGMMEAILSRTP
ncbi:MAG TPA: serine hydrolase [Terriglobales bacterium]|nr:serine hydrolase [Terriglobales bacterium]